MAKKNKAKNFILYGGVSRDEFDQIKDVISLENLKVWKIVSIVLVGIAMALLILTFAWPEYFGTVELTPEQIDALCAKYGIAYAVLAAYGCILAFILHVFGKKHLKIVNPLVFISSILVLSFFIATSTILDNENISVVYMVLIVGMSLVTVRKPLEGIALIGSATIAFVIMVAIFERPVNIDVFQDDLLYSIVFGFVSILFGIFFNYIRIKDFSLKFFVEKQRDVDALTKVKSKMAYDREVSYITERLLQNSECDPFALVIFNVNGLKLTNDTYGHEMGDELLLRAVEMISTIYENSQIYRIAGDEFAILLKAEDYKNRNDLIRKFRGQVYQTHEESTSLMDDTPIACGMATYDPVNDIDFMSVFSRADTIMYDDKRMLRTRNEYLKNPVKYLDED